MNNVIEEGNNARLVDRDLIAGLKSNNVPINDPKAGEVDQGECLAAGFLKNLRVQSEIDFVNRYKWYGLETLGCGMTQELLERMLYYRGQVGLFYDEGKESFVILPYVLNSEKEQIDIFGRFQGISFLPFNGTAEVDGKPGKKRKIYIPGELKIPRYEIGIQEELSDDDILDSAILLTDYTKQIAQNIIPQVQLQEAFMKMEAEIYPMARTALISQCGIRALKLSNGNQNASIRVLNQSIYDAAMKGELFLGFTGDAITEQLGAIPAAKPEEYLLYLQSLENQRLASLGLENGGIFQKKAHELQTEADMAKGNSSNVYLDGLINRQNFCIMVRSYFPNVRIWCTAKPMDQNLNTMQETDNEQDDEQSADEAPDNSDKEV